MHARTVTLIALISAGSLLVVSCGKSDVEVEVLDFEMPVATDAEPPDGTGQVWAALNVEMCSNIGADDGAALGAENWVLEMPDETRISPTARAVPGSPSPTLNPGGLYMLSMDECVEGWIVFAVPASTQPSAAIFDGPGGSKRFSLS